MISGKTHAVVILPSFLLLVLNPARQILSLSANIVGFSAFTDALLGKAEKQKQTAPRNRLSSGGSCFLMKMRIFLERKKNEEHRKKDSGKKQQIGTFCS
jgi:hypothetical protein